MKKNRIAKFLSSTLVLGCFVLSSCGDSAEDYSFSQDHKIPEYKIYNDSIIVDKGQTVDISVDFSDESGLSKIACTYSDWGISENILLKEQGNPPTYTLNKTITIPADAATEWEETVQRNDGSTYKRTQHYHSITIKATDTNLNVRTVSVRIKVKP
ncbi:MAG: hypothetical protein ACK5MK_00405 [Dysgonomonas sp.]